MSKQFSEGVGFQNILFWHVSEWGELFLNTSRFKILHYFPASVVNGLFFLIGLLAIAGFLYACFQKQKSIPVIIGIYAALYMLLIFNWPFSDPRFWVPLIPLIAAVISQADFLEKPLFRAFGILVLVFYSLTGLISLAYITYTSFNKKEFAKTQAKGLYRNEYETHFFGKTLSDTVTQVDLQIVQFLDKYDK